MTRRNDDALRSTRVPLPSSPWRRGVVAHPLESLRGTPRRSRDRTRFALVQRRSNRGGKHERQTLHGAPRARRSPGAPGLRRRRRGAVHPALRRRRRGAGDGPDSVPQIEQAGARRRRRASRSDAAPAPRAEPTWRHDVEQLSMSTLSFQDYVRERMLKRRQAELRAAAAPSRRGRPAAHAARRRARRRARHRASPRADRCRSRDEACRRAAPSAAPATPAPRRRARRDARHAERAALDEGPDRGALRRAGLHGEAAAPARRRRA